jgi:hypothetical protein
MNVVSGGGDIVFELENDPDDEFSFRKHSQPHSRNVTRVNTLLHNKTFYNNHHQEPLEEKK